MTSEHHKKMDKATSAATPHARGSHGPRAAAVQGWAGDGGGGVGTPGCQGWSQGRGRGDGGVEARVGTCAAPGRLQTHVGHVVGQVSHIHLDAFVLVSHVGHHGGRMGTHARALPDVKNETTCCTMYSGR